MRVFEKSSDEGWGNRLNIVDENNVVVGFDYSQDCCEDFGHAFLNAIPEGKLECDYREMEQAVFKHEDYVFDPDFFKDDLPEGEYCDGGKAVAFKLVSPGKPDVYLILYNAHNGYYGHDFTVDVGGCRKHEGCL